MQGEILRWFDPHQEDKRLIRNFDSLLAVVRLARITSNWWLRLFCIVWVSDLLLETISRISSHSICFYLSDLDILQRNLYFKFLPPFCV